ncbi:MAG: hypothetical protein JWN04_426 [Myxococcaceae bacterium]|nr:hypothetical protein [Myxococcaceae bacterium]
MPRKLPLFTLLCLACGPARPPEGAPPQPAPVARDSLSARASPLHVASEVLAKDAHYADLVRAASELEGSTREPSSRPSTCLLAQTGSDFRLRAELASAVRPLPLPPDDLDQSMKNAAHVELLSAWGRHGDGNGKLALAAFSSSAPTSTAFALLLTDRGLALRSPSGSTAAPLDELDLPRALSALATLDPARSANVFVAAEASFPLRELYRVLAGLGAAQRRVVLAVSLAPNTALPLPVSATAKVARCPDGLSATDAPEGSLPASELMAGIAPLKEHAADCLARGDARGAAGGRLRIAFRIAANGHVQEACIVSDQLDDAGVANCVIGLASQLRFAPPSPTGVLDLELPIALQASPQVVQNAVCGPS